MEIPSWSCFGPAPIRFLRLAGGGLGIKCKFSYFTFILFSLTCHAVVLDLCCPSVWHLWVIRDERNVAKPADMPLPRTLLFYSLTALPNPSTPTSQCQLSKRLWALLSCFSDLGDTSSFVPRPGIYRNTPANFPRPHKHVGLVGRCRKSKFQPTFCYSTTISFYASIEFNLSVSPIVLVLFNKGSSVILRS